ncbi:MAG: hypothetical protein ACOYT9_03950 [Patescibacteria group bacterium]
MRFEQKVYTEIEVAQLLTKVVSELSGALQSVDQTATEKKIEAMNLWAAKYDEAFEDLIVEEVVKRHVQGITLCVWAGPPGSGKGTNIETVNVIGGLYAEVASQGGARQLPEPMHSRLLNFSLAQSIISTGTKGMFNKPEGEYATYFSALVPEFGSFVAAGGFVPDAVVSILVEAMILLRLVQHSHKIQIDLWPRTAMQFVAFDRLVQKIRANGGKVQEEVVTIKVLKKESMELVKQHLAESAKISKVIAAKINEYLKSEWYAALCNKAALVEDMKERYRVEKEGLTEVFSRLTGEYSDSLSLAVIEELKIVCDRMEFRFNLVVEKGGIPRPDEYPLSVIRRLAVYTGETAPVFLEQTAEKNAKKGYYVVSSAGTPQEVIAEILTTLAGAAEITDQWESILSLAGEIANSIVYKKELVVEELLKRVGGILES